MEAIGRSIRRLKYFGRERYCPACESHSRCFGTYGSPPRPDARCLICNSSERERAQTLLLRRKVLPRLEAKARHHVLHIAPEQGVARLLRQVGGPAYVSGDVEPGRAMQVVDLTNLQFSTASIDLFFASHVLEHIADDRRAISEIYRVLSPNGFAFIEVPVLCRETYENPDVVSQPQRLEQFGQTDHVRMCGIDYENRLQSAGFLTEALWIENEFSSADVETMRLKINLPEDIRLQMPARYEAHYHVAWICRKQRGGVA
jgi:SAM-dependent methyltransferase